MPLYSLKCKDVYKYYYLWFNVLKDDARWIDCAYRRFNKNIQSSRQTAIENSLIVQQERRKIQDSESAVKVCWVNHFLTEEQFCWKYFYAVQYRKSLYANKYTTSIDNEKKFLEWSNDELIEQTAINLQFPLVTGSFLPV